MGTRFRVYLRFGKMRVECAFGTPKAPTLTYGIGVKVMAQVCDICGKGPQFGNNISHAHNVSRRRWNVNLQAVKALVNGSAKRIRVCTSCIKAGKIAKA